MKAALLGGVVASLTFETSMEFPSVKQEAWSNAPFSGSSISPLLLFLLLPPHVEVKPKRKNPSSRSSELLTLFHTIFFFSRYDSGPHLHITS